jgi:selenocysteine-specific elongation factor
MTEKHFILATAGHVDHGKSALVKALTGTDPDRLPEEKARRITIDLGFAELNVTGPNGEKFHVGIVDVPGHEDFVRNMIAGVGSIDLALLVIAAGDGWMPQTEEHLQILIYLGVNRALIALTKADLAKTDNVMAQIRGELRDTPFANSQIVPTSVRTGQGIENLRRALACEFTSLPISRDIGKPRLFVDRAFSLRGTGTVVTGTLAGGELRRGQIVAVHPKNLSARIRSIQCHGHNVELAKPGMRTAINLPDVEVGKGPESVERGDVIAVADLSTASKTVDVVLEKSSRLNLNEPAARPLNNGTPVHIYVGAARVEAKLAMLDNDTIEPGQRAIAQLRLNRPILAFVGDRLIVRDSSERCTVAGGIVLDLDGDRKRFRDEAQGELLRARASAAENVDLYVQSQLRRDAVSETRELLVKSHFGTDEIAAALSRLEACGEVVLHDEIAANAVCWSALVEHSSKLIDQAHEKHPEQRGLPLVELRTALRDQADDVFEALISDLYENGFMREGSIIARRSHRAALPSPLQSAADKIRSALAARLFDPPSRKEFLQDRHQEQSLRFLIEQGEIVEISEEIVLLGESLEQMRTAISKFISTNGPATASQLREKIGTSRRVIIPVLEYLDRKGVTQRSGDLRRLRESSGIARS